MQHRVRQHRAFQLAEKLNFDQERRGIPAHPDPIADRAEDARAHMGAKIVFVRPLPTLEEMGLYEDADGNVRDKDGDEIVVF